MKNKSNSQYVERFLVGFCIAGTPFSAKLSKEVACVNNLLSTKAHEMQERDDINFWDDDIAESICYFGGSLVGLTVIPIDALLTGVFTVRETFRGMKV